MKKDFNYRKTKTYLHIYSKKINNKSREYHLIQKRLVLQSLVSSISLLKSSLFQKTVFLESVQNSIVYHVTEALTPPSNINPLTGYKRGYKITPLRWVIF